MPTERYFPNDFQPTGAVNISESLYKTTILSYVELIQEKVKKNDRSSSKGLYTGTAGIAYALYYLSKSELFQEFSTQFLNDAKSYIKYALQEQNTTQRKELGFLSGNGGVYAVAALIFNKTNDFEESRKYLKLYKELASQCMSQDFTGRGSDELFVGRSGYLLGLLLLRRDLKTEVLPNEQVDLVIQMLLKSGKNYSAEINMTERLPLMYQYHGKPYLGSAHGLAGILQVLMSFSKYFKQHPDEMSKLKKSIEFLMDTCVRNGNVATNLDGSLSGQGKNLVHWCHGASGVIYTFARAYLLFGKDDKYLKTCHELAETVWEKGLLKKGPGICHGVSGSGYVFLLMYRLTGDSKYLYRAERFANFLLSEKFKREARIPDKPYSLFEGLAGTVCFLTDLLKPTTAEFPLCNVFVDL